MELRENKVVRLVASSTKSQDKSDANYDRNGKGVKIHQAYLSGVNNVHVS